MKVRAALFNFGFIMVTLMASSAWAIPYVDGGYGVKELSDSKTLSATLFTGHKDDGDETTVYAPWSKLEIVKDNSGRPKFSFSYSRKGALMVATVKASIDQEAVKTAYQGIKQSMVAKGISEEQISLRPIPVHNGVYRFAIKSLTSDAEWVIATSEIQNALPDNEVVVSALMGRAAADLVVLSLKNAYTTLGVNYSYDFPGRTTPYRAQITLHWHNILNYLHTYFGYRMLFASIDIDTVVRRLVEKKDIAIRIIEGDGAQTWNNVISDIVKIVIARTFKAHHPEPSMQKPNIEKPGFWDTLFGFGGNAAFSLEFISSYEVADETYEIYSQPYRMFTATAGVQFPGKCEAYPDNFAYQGYVADPATGGYAIEKGCPPKVYGEVPPPSQQVKPKTDAEASIGGMNLGTSKENQVNDSTVSVKEKEIFSK